MSSSLNLPVYLYVRTIFGHLNHCNVLTCVQRRMRTTMKAFSVFGFVIPRSCVCKYTLSPMMSDSCAVLYIYRHGCLVFKTPETSVFVLDGRWCSGCSRWSSHVTWSRHEPPGECGSLPITVHSFHLVILSFLFASWLRFWRFYLFIF